MSKSRRSRTRAAKARAAGRRAAGEQLAASLDALPKFTTLYFAYGSNMPSRDMQARCPGARNPRVARLDNYRLHFSGCADVREAEGAEVYGIVWEVTDAHMKSLDRYEGCATDPWKPGGFYQRKLVTVDIGGTPTEVTVYVMCEDAARGRAYLPGGYYVNTLERGYQEFGITQGAESLRWALNEITALHAGRELTLDRKGRARPAGDALYVPEAFRATAPAWPRSRAGQRAVARERNLEAQRRSQARLAAGYELPVGFVEVEDGDARASARVFLEGEGMLDWEIDMVLDDVDAQADALGYVPETADYLEGGTASRHEVQTLDDVYRQIARNQEAEAV